MATTPTSPIRRSGESTVWRRFRLDCALLTARGAGSARNDDHCVFAGPGAPEAEAAAAGYLFAVIDGESAGGKGGAVARETGTSLLEILEDPRREELRPDLLLQRLQDANDRCHRFLGGRCAVTAVWIWEEPGAPQPIAAWAHVGNTRLYHHGAAGWRCLTTDHAKGRLLDRAIGQGPGLVVETGSCRLQPEERLLLVSAGVWKMATPKSVLSSGPFPTVAGAARRLVGQARLNGSRDDTSAIVIAARPAAAGPEPED